MRFFVLKGSHLDSLFFIFYKKCGFLEVDYYNYLLVSNKNKINWRMGKLLKSFCTIFVCSLGIGVSYAISLISPTIGSVLFGGCCILDLVIILRMLCGCRTCLFELASVFGPSIVLICYFFSMWQYCDIWLKSCFFVLGCSSLIAILGLPVWWAVFLFERIKKLYLGKV